MTKTNFSVEIHRNGFFNDGIIKLISNHNERLSEVDINLLVASCKVYDAMYPSETRKTHLNHNVGERTLFISEKGKSTISIYERDCFEEVVEDDIKGK